MMMFKRSVYNKTFGLLVVLVVIALFFQGITYLPPDIDHAKVIRSLNSETLKRGKEIFNSACVACHGKDGTASLPQARSFNKDGLRFGNKPYDMWKTITFGAGMMAAQTWIDPAERYYVIQYIREEFMKKSNSRRYFKVTDKYLATLPKSQRTIEQQLAETKKQALKGSLKYGQEWFMHHESNYGNAIHSQLKDKGTAILSIKLDNNVMLSYNLLRMGTVAAWKGKLNYSDTKYNQYRGEGEPFIEGKELPGLDVWQWTYNGKLDSLTKVAGVRTPLSADFLQYHGHYKNEKKVVLSYSIAGRKIFEYPQAKKQNNNISLVHSMNIEPGEAQSIYIGRLKDTNVIFNNVTDGVDDLSAKGNVSSLLVTSGKTKGKFIAASIISKEKGFRLAVDKEGRILMTVPESKKVISVSVLRTTGKNQQELNEFSKYAKAFSIDKIPDISGMIRGGPASWSSKPVVKGELDASMPHSDPKYFEDEDKMASGKLVKLPKDYPYAVDHISLPFNNAYNAWIRPTSVAFTQSGQLLITTYLGDVWMATGVDSALKNITWQRIATGLFEPMGMKVIRDRIYVTSRNGITILNDLNNDGETDYYENFHSDHDVSAFFHAFNFGLETDSKGNLYYVKPGQYTNNRDPGNVIRVSADGKQWESIATGFRVNNGITVTPDDRIFVSDNQGNWTPGNKINFIKKDKFYGYVQNLVDGGWSPDGMKIEKKDIVNGVISPAIIPVPDTFEAPALWIPQEFDNSPGGGVWSPKTWGPLGNQFIHTSYGTGWMYYFLPHEVKGIVQGAMVAMPFQFEAGIQRAAVNPVDQQIYVTGLTGWDDGVSLKYGALSRVRYIGGEGHLLKDAEVVKGGIKLTFNFMLDDERSINLKNFQVSNWNYNRTSRYGSAHYSLKNPGQEGEDAVTVKNIIRSDDENSLVLEIPNMQPVHTMRIRLEVKGKDGTILKDVVYLTINVIPE